MVLVAPWKNSYNNFIFNRNNEEKMKKYIIALLALACLSAVGYSKDWEAEIIKKLNQNVRLDYSISHEVRNIADNIVDLANKQAREKKNYIAYWNATLVNFMGIIYEDEAFMWASERTLANVKLWSDRAIEVSAGKAAPELYVIRFLTLWHYYRLNELTFFPEKDPIEFGYANQRSQFEVWAPNHKREIREMLNEFEKAEKINPTVAYREIAHKAVWLYGAIGNNAKVAELNRTLQRMETDRKASVTKQNQSLARKQQFVKRQVKTNMAFPTNTAPLKWYEGVFFRGGGHF